MDLVILGYVNLLLIQEGINGRSPLCSTCEARTSQSLLPMRSAVAHRPDIDCGVHTIIYKAVTLECKAITCQNCRFHLLHQTRKKAVLQLQFSVWLAHSVFNMKPPPPDFVECFAS